MAYLIDANGETITLGTAAIPTTGSLAMWVYPPWNAATDTVDRMFLVLVGPPNTYFYCDKTSGKAMEFGWYTNAEYRAVAAAGTYTLNQNAWNSIICTWDDAANLTYLYLNGAQIASKNTLATWNTNGVTRYLGTRNDGELFFNGRFAEVLIWPRVITSGERARFDAGLLPVGGAVGNDWWPLIGNANNVWAGANGTVTNATVVDHPDSIIHTQNTGVSERLFNNRKLAGRLVA